MPVGRNKRALRSTNSESEPRALFRRNGEGGFNPELFRRSGECVIVGSNDNDQYVLLDTKVYQRYRALFESDEFEISETYGAQEQTLGDGAVDVNPSTGNQFC